MSWLGTLGWLIIVFFIGTAVGFAAARKDYEEKMEGFLIKTPPMSLEEASKMLEKLQGDERGENSEEE